MEERARQIRVQLADFESGWRLVDSEKDAKLFAASAAVQDDASKSSVQSPLTLRSSSIRGQASAETTLLGPLQLHTESLELQWPEYYRSRT
jgi:hypothetical protein